MNIGNIGNMLGGIGQLTQISQIISMVKQGGNPIGLVQQLSQQNPEMGQAINMAMQATQGKSPQEAMQIAKKILNEKGIDPGEVSKQLGINI